MASVEAKNGRASRTARRTIDTDPSYREAKRTVEWLSDQGFAVEHLSMVGTGLRYIEDVPGRLTTGRSAAMDVAQGAMRGLLFGLFFTHAADFFGVVLYGLVAGTVSGATWGALLHYSQRGRRDFGPVAGPSLIATRYRPTTRWPTRRYACSRGRRARP